MVDKFSAKSRSSIMRLVKSKNTKPELIVRKLVYKLGYRYRLHRSELPGKPDLVFTSRRKIIFVHGCFWHQHPACKNARLPKSRQEYWVPKLIKNQARDQLHLEALHELGWQTLVLWECELNDENFLTRRLIEFLTKKH